MAKKQYKDPKDKKKWVSEEKYYKRLEEMQEEEQDSDSKPAKSLSDMSKSDLWDLVKEEEIEGLEWTSKKSEMIKQLKENK